MRNLPQTPIIFLVYSPKSYFLAFWGPFWQQLAKLHKAMHWLELRPQTRVSGLRLKLTKAMRVVTQVAVTGMQVITRDFVRKSKLKFWSYVKSVVTQGSTVLSDWMGCTHKGLRWLSDMSNHLVICQVHTYYISITYSNLHPFIKLLYTILELLTQWLPDNISDSKVYSRLSMPKLLTHKCTNL
jgi:hypothetical protein